MENAGHLKFKFTLWLLWNNAYKVSPAKVGCCIYMLTSQTNFNIQANSVGPDQNVPLGAVWSESTLFATETL